MGITLEKPFGEINWTIKAGSLNPLSLQFYDDDGALMDFTSYTAEFAIKQTSLSSTALLTLTSSPAAGITINTGTATVTVSVSISNITTLAGYNCLYGELKLIPPAGAASAYIPIICNITRER
jgi:hypothetical protein